MELATIELKLSGDVHNTVVKHRVTPSELSVYAYMHGEDCVDGVQITGVDKERTVREEMDRLRGIFKTEEASICLNKIFPGMAPALVVTFAALGYVNNQVLGGGADPLDLPPQPSSEAAASSQKKIQDQEAARQAAADADAAAPPPVSPEELAAIQNEQLDETGGALDLTDSPIDQELQIHGTNEYGEEVVETHPAPPAQQATG